MGGIFSSQSKLILLDRDGVINEDSDEYVRSVSEWVPIPGSIEAISNLSKEGYILAVVTNQSGIGRKYFTQEVLCDMHNKLYTLVEKEGGKIATIVFCPHLPQDNCNCRKPAVGLVKQVEQRLKISAKNAWFVGDSYKDIQVALTCDCNPVLVKTGKGMTTLSHITTSEINSNHVMVFESLYYFAEYLLNGGSK